MPNASRLVAALCLGFLAFMISSLIIPLYDEGTDFGWFTHVNVVVGLLSGWIVMGKRAGHGITAAINNGIAGVVSMMFWGLFVHSTVKMVELAMRNRYNGPFEAIIAIFEEGYAYATDIAVPQIFVTLIVGAVVSGLATEYAWRRWR